MLQGLLLMLQGTVGCSAQVISAECSDVQYFNTSDISYINEFDYLYINKDSSVQLILSNKTSPSYYAWIFNDVQLAMQHSCSLFLLQAMHKTQRSKIIILKRHFVSANFNFNQFCHSFIHSDIVCSYYLLMIIFIIIPPIVRQHSVSVFTVNAYV